MRSFKTLAKKVKGLPDSPGIYRFIDSNGQIIYIGKAKSLKQRVSSYFANKNLGPKTNMMVSLICDVKIIKVFSEFEALLLEAELIKNHQPFFNIQAKDDKSPLCIKISEDKIPIISTARNEKPKKGVFLIGPFPSSATAKSILKMIRKIFPYCQHKNPKKPCLYVHLGLCPYPYANSQACEKYMQDLKYIKKLLKGQSKSLIRGLKKTMQSLSLAQKYEEANVVKRQIEMLQFLTTTYHAPKEFLEQPTLVDDLTISRLKDLQTVLNLKKLPKRIECYDISNIQGKLATGSMVVFENGKSAKSEYRRFKIKFLTRPDDYEMLTQVLSRRLKNNWPIPELMVIDGGKGQLGAALNAINKSKASIPVIALAKRFEEIYTPGLALPISLPKQSPARQLVEELRNEAHRFAITYHRLLRSKQMLA